MANCTLTFSIKDRSELNAAPGVSLSIRFLMVDNIRRPAYETTALTDANGEVTFQVPQGATVIFASEEISSLNSWLYEVGRSDAIFVGVFFVDLANEANTGGGGGASSFADLDGDPYDNSNLADALDAKQDALGFTPENSANKATDFSTINDTKYPSVKAVDDRISSQVTGLWDDRGSFDASGNAFPSSGGSGTAGAVVKGDIWTISVAGILGGSAVTAGDTVRALTNSPGQTASNWALGENNLGYVPLNKASNLSDLASASAARTNLGLGSRATQNDTDAIILGGGTAAQITANKNNYDPGVRTPVIRLSSDALRDITGLAFSTAAVDGEEHILINEGSFGINLLTQNTNSTAANRFFIEGTGNDVRLVPFTTCTIRYDSNLSRWLVILPVLRGGALPAADRLSTWDGLGRLQDGGAFISELATVTALNDLGVIVADLPKADTSVFKAGDIARNSTTDIQLDDDGSGGGDGTLRFPLADNGGRYKFSIRAYFNAGTGGLKVGLVLASGVDRIKAQVKIFSNTTQTLATTGFIENISTDGLNGDTVDAAVTGSCYVEIDGYLIAENPGDFGLGWGQQTSLVDDTTCLQDSVISYSKVGDV